MRRPLSRGWRGGSSSIWCHLFMCSSYNHVMRRRRGTNIRLHYFESTELLSFALSWYSELLWLILWRAIRACVGSWWGSQFVCFIMFLSSTVVRGWWSNRYRLSAQCRSCVLGVMMKKDAVWYSAVKLLLQATSFAMCSSRKLQWTNVQETCTGSLQWTPDSTH